MHTCVNNALKALLSIFRTIFFSLSACVEYVEYYFA
jgi:hypothetical protein